jgi:cytochrome c553
VRPFATCAVVIGLVLMTGRAEAQERNTPPDLVRRECSACHGLRGISVSPMFPNLAGQQAVYLENQLKAFRDRSRADPHAQAFMWGMAAQLSDSKIVEIAAYFASQPPAPGKPAGSDETIAGKKIFAEGIAAQQVPACASCHGEKAAGNAMFPRLAGQHRAYLERQLAAFISNARANEIMHETSKNLTALQISELAAFLSSLP